MPEQEVGILAECDHCGEDEFTVYFDEPGGRIFKIKCLACGMVSHA